MTRQPAVLNFAQGRTVVVEARDVANWIRLEALAAAAERELPAGAVKDQLASTLRSIGWRVAE